MKKIKMAVLAVALLCGAVGGYAQMNKQVYNYYVAAGTWFEHDFYQVKANPPSGITCSSTVLNEWVCQIQSAEIWLPDDWVPQQDVTILKGYSQ